MSFSDLDRARLTKVLTAWSDEVPERVRDQLRYAFRIGASDVVMYESRPNFLPPHQWVDHDVAKFRFVAAAGEWRLFCKFRDGKWRAYQPLPSAPSFETLYAEVRRDPTHIFWG
ncbi:MAG: DUF3024 domain-containing protein [Gemmatimonadaceae bacterium]|nr:DUF3024 domain-containing protein [Gemmatimonadaceae bacterium]